MDEIRSRLALCSDADAAAQRFIASGIEQPNPELRDTEAHAIWAAAFVRLVAFYSDPVGDCEASA